MKRTGTITVARWMCLLLLVLTVVGCKKKEAEAVPAAPTGATEDGSAAPQQSAGGQVQPSQPAQATD